MNDKFLYNTLIYKYLILLSKLEIIDKDYQHQYRLSLGDDFTRHIMLDGLKILINSMHEENKDYAKSIANQFLGDF